jgi:glycerate kinase
MSSIEVCRVIQDAVRSYYPACETVPVPVADGGEGSVDCFLSAVDGEKVWVDVKGPLFENRRACYGILHNDTAVIELASCAGLPLVENKGNPMATTTYGVGQMMLHAVRRGCKKIILGLGGSCTNDGGTGAAAALGIRFYDGKGREFIPVGGTLKDISRIDVAGREKLLDGATITAMCDVDNVMHGAGGAACVFAPQKGADSAMVEKLDNGLKYLSEIFKTQLGLDVSEIAGSGAAGAMGAGVVAFFGSELRLGIQIVLDVVGFDEMLRNADIVFTGEGKIDRQSLRGKVVAGVAQRAKKQGIPVVAVVGDIGDDIDEIYAMGVNAIFSINRVALPFENAKLRCKSDLALTMDSILRFSQIKLY